MEEKHKDLRVVRTKEAIRNAFKELVCQVPFEKITVKGISERARINRNTFYLHYETVEDVIQEIQKDYSDEYLKLVDGLDLVTDQKRIVRTFFTFMESQDEFFKRITCDSRFDVIREGMQRKVMSRTNEKATAVQNIVQCYSRSTLYLYRQWVSDGRKIPLEAMINLATLLMEHGVEGLSLDPVFDQNRAGHRKKPGGGHHTAVSRGLGKHHRAVD